MRGTRKDFNMPSRVEVLNLVNAFLDGPQRKSKHGGFAEVPEGDKAELDALILALVKYRYEPDPDGDRPIRWLLSDWSREEILRFRPLPRGGKPQTRLAIAQLNVALASETLRDVVQDVIFGQEEE